MLVTIHSSRPIGGSITAPPSKSMAHRAVLCAALATGSSHITNLEFSKDISATLAAAGQLCARVTTGPADAVVEGLGRFAPLTAPVDCCESGSTLRFLIPIASLTGQEVTFTGRGRLMERPQEPYFRLFTEKGIAWSLENGVLAVEGRLTPGVYALPGDVSSQFITGLLLALPLCGGDSEIVLSTPLESAAYVTMTVEAMARAGVAVETTGSGWRVPGGQTYRPHEETVEADWSQAAFLLAAGALGGGMVLTGLNPRSVQGDREALDLFRRFGAAVTEEGGRIHCRRAPLHGIDIDASQIPDLVPVLAVTAALAEGTTRITGAARLRLKESDRLAAAAHCLRLLGGRVEERPDGLVIEGRPFLPGGEVPGYNDHRIVMSMAVAALGCRGPVTIGDAGSVRKSWPAFFTDYQRIGGIVHVLEYR